MSHLDPTALRALIHNTLQPLGLWSAGAEELLMATCANESALGTYRTQAPHGPARGIFQCEGPTYNDVWANYLRYHLDLSTAIQALNNGVPGTADDLVNNDPLAVAIARVQYLRAPEPIPAADDIEGIWAIYKKRYNSANGAATHDAFIANYDRYVKGQ